MTTFNPNEYYSISEVARQWGISRQAIYRSKKYQPFIHRPMPNSSFMRKEDAHKFLEERQKRGVEDGASN